MSFTLQLSACIPLLIEINTAHDWFCRGTDIRVKTQQLS